MAGNPMQRQARNSFLLGMFITILIAGAIIALLFLQTKNIREENTKFRNSLVDVYVLAQDVKSGDTITPDMFMPAKAYKDSVPGNYTDINTVLTAYSLYTKDGNPIRSEYRKENDKDENETISQHLYLDLPGEDGKIIPTEVFREDSRYYYVNKEQKREYIETTTAPVIAKIEAKAGSIISPTMVTRSYDILTNDVRKQEYNMLVLPMDLLNGDFIDIRLMLPNGQDFIVTSKKKVEIPMVNGIYSSDTISMKMSEIEILTMSNAIVEAYTIEGSKLYATKYTDPGIQNAAIPTYVPSALVRNLMGSDPNILDTAKSALANRYNSLIQRRSEELDALASNEEGKENIKTKVEESAQSTQETRKQYLQSLATPATTPTTTN